MYSIAPYIIGMDSIKDVNIETFPKKLIEKGRNITKKILGIEVKQKDNVFLSLKLKKINDEIIPIKQPPLNNYQTITHFQTSFDETIIEQDYYSQLDILSNLGGISASVHMVIGGISFLFIIHFMRTLSGMILR